MSTCTIRDAWLVLQCLSHVRCTGRFVDQAMEAFERQVQVNYLGTVATIKAALPGMLERKQGHVVLIASALAVLGDSWDERVGRLGGRARLQV